MLTPFTSNHFTDAEGHPAGGATYGTGFAIAWQNGPLAKDVAPKECLVDHEQPGQEYGQVPCRRAPNGAFVETIIAAARDRLEFYQGTEFACYQNADAIRHLEEALSILRHRTADREARGVEGTHEK